MKAAFGVMLLLGGILFCSSVQPVTATSKPQHFIYFGIERSRINEAPFLESRGIVGAQLKYRWQELEPSRDQYDLELIRHDLKFLEAHGKKLFLQIQDVTFEEALVNVPDYLLSDPVFGGGVARQYSFEDEEETLPIAEGWVARRWDPQVQLRLIKLFNALGKEFDGRIEGITLPETSIGFRRGELQPSGYTYRGYYESVKLLMTAAGRAFPRSHVIQYANFMPGESLPGDDHGYLRGIYQHADAIGVGVGGPDLLPHRRWQRIHSYSLIKNRNPDTIAGVAVQWGNLADRNPNTGERVTVAELNQYARDSLGLDYIFWGTQEPYYSKDILPYLSNPEILKGQTIVERGTSKVFHLDSSAKLTYSKDAKGNRLPDFSHVGYHSGERAIPHVPVRITLEPSGGDDTKRIQDSLDKLGTLPLDETGFRGALLLKRGVYRVEGSLRMSHSGTVLRGEGNGPDGTVIIAAGYDDAKYRRALITVAPKSEDLETHIEHGYPREHVKLVENSGQAIIDAYVPVGSHSFEVESASGYEVGDRIVVQRPSTTDWIHLIGCDEMKPRWAEYRNARWVKDGKAPGFYYQRLGSYSKYCMLRKQDEKWEDFVKRVPLSEDGKTLNFTRQWEAGHYDFYFERRITGIEGNRITIDAPIVHSMDRELGGGAIYHYETPERVTEVGIENLRLVSEFAPPAPGHPYGNPEEAKEAEDHAWHGIQLKSDTENTWVRDVTGNYFGWSLVSASGKRATVQDCVNLGHASKITGARRYPFMINGQLNLVQRCLAFDGRHEFVTQQRTAGPNVFVDCLGVDSRENSGPHHRYSIGTLFDNVKSEKPMESRFRGRSGTGHGWAGTQTCFYNCVAPEFMVEAPPGGISWVIGSADSGEESARVAPASLYYQQVQDRLGKAALDRLATAEQREQLGQHGWVKKRLEKENKAFAGEAFAKQEKSPEE